jgi:hypothetical protein
VRDRPRFRPLAFATAVALSLLPHVASGKGPAPPTLVVTTSMLEIAARELLPADGEIRVVTLIPPGSCPGHFDLSPRLLPELQAAVAVIRHDYQAPLGAQIERLAGPGLGVVAVRGEGSLTVPAHYLGLVRQVSLELGRRFPEKEGTFAAAVEQTGVRLGRLEGEVEARPSPWRGARVVASAQQAELCSWLGLEVVAELGRAEDTVPRDLETLLSADPALVVGNLQEGTEAASGLSERLGRPLAVLSNFPGAPGYGSSFDDLLRANLERLDAAWARR